MKTTFFKLALPLCALLLSSCLGDSKVEIKRENDFGVIMASSEAGKNYASTPYYAIWSQQIGGQGVGTAGYFKYTISSWNTLPGTNIVVADQGELVTVIPHYDMTTSINQSTIDEYDSPIAALKWGGVSGGEGIGDYWLWQYVANMKKSDRMSIICFYDKDNQFDAPKTGEEKGEPVSIKEDGKIIIDVRFKKIESSDPGNELVLQRNEDIALVLAAMRGKDDFKPTATDDDGYKRLRIKYRYLQKGSKETDKVEVKYLGEWGGVGESARATYYFIHAKEE